MLTVQWEKRGWRIKIKKMDPLSQSFLSWVITKMYLRKKCLTLITWHSSTNAFLWNTRQVLKQFCPRFGSYWGWKEMSSFKCVVSYVSVYFGLFCITTCSALKKKANERKWKGFEEGAFILDSVRTLFYILPFINREIQKHDKESIALSYQLP